MNGFIVVFDDGQGLAAPYGWDADVDGGLEAYGKAVAVFATRKQAQHAIRISAAAARLAIAQGRLRPDGSDFVGPAARCIKVVPLVEGGAR